MILPQISWGDAASNVADVIITAYVIYGVLLLPLPYPNPDQIVRLWEQNAKGGQMNFADPNFEDVRSQSRNFPRRSGSRSTSASPKQTTRIHAVFCNNRLAPAMQRGSRM